MKIGEPVLGLKLFFAEKLLLSWSELGVHVFCALELDLLCVLQLNRQPTLVKELGGNVYFCLDTGLIVSWSPLSPESHVVFKVLCFGFCCPCPDPLSRSFFF